MNQSIISLDEHCLKIKQTAETSIPEKFYDNCNCPPEFWKQLYKDTVYPTTEEIATLVFIDLPNICKKYDPKYKGLTAYSSLKRLIRKCIQNRIRWPKDRSFLSYDGLLEVYNDNRE